jgi:hypothetical protein
MKRALISALLSFCVAFAVCFGIAHGDGMSVPGVPGEHDEDSTAYSYPPSSGGGGSFSLTYESTNVVSTAATSIDFGTMTYGSGCTRVIAALSVSFIATGSASISSVTINGVSATAVSGAASTWGSTAGVTDIWESNSSVSGSSGDVTVTYNNTTTTFGNNANSVTLYCLVTSTPTAAHAVPVSNSPSGVGLTLSGSITVPTGGGAIGVGLDVGQASLASPAWTAGLTQDARNTSYAAGHTTSTGSVATTLTDTTNNATLQMSLAAWGP